MSGTNIRPGSGDRGEFAAARIDYDGPDESVECAYPGCTNRLRKSEYDEPQFCSREHRDGCEHPAAYTDSEGARVGNAPDSGNAGDERPVQPTVPSDAPSAATSWLRRRWECFRHGHRWHSPLPFGADFCERCGKLVEW